MLTTADDRILIIAENSLDFARRWGNCLRYSRECLMLFFNGYSFGGQPPNTSTLSALNSRPVPVGLGTNLPLDSTEAPNDISFNL